MIKVTSKDVNTPYHCPHKTDVRYNRCTLCAAEKMMEKAKNNPREKYQCGSCGSFDNSRNYAPDPLTDVFAICDKCRRRFQGENVFDGTCD